MPLIMDDVRARWNTVAADLPQPEAAGLLNELRQRYSEPHRFYHALPHVLSVLQVLDRLTVGVSEERLAALRLAAWYHDIVYDTRAHDNEEQSAQLMLARLQRQGVSSVILDRAACMIRATAKHIVPEDCPDAVLLLDADLAVLGAPSDAYDRYADQIRREYAWVPEADYRTGRTAILTSFLNRERIFLTAAMHDAYEMVAVGNLKREIATLGTSAP